MSLPTLRISHVGDEVRKNFVVNRSPAYQPANHPLAWGLDPPSRATCVVPSCGPSGEFEPRQKRQSEGKEGTTPRGEKGTRSREGIGAGGSISEEKCC